MAKQKSRELSRSPNEQEGFRRAVSVPDGEVPWCSSASLGGAPGLSDFRGAAGESRAHPGRDYVEWETTPARGRRITVFTWIGGSQVRPAMRPAFPYVAARLTVNGKRQVMFPLGVADAWSVSAGDLTLEFEPRRFVSLAEMAHRVFDAPAVSGFYRLKVPGRHMAKGRPVLLRVDLSPSVPGCETLFFVSPRRDALAVNLAVLREEVGRLEKDMVALRKACEMLSAQVHPWLFPKRIEGQLVVVHQEETTHLHPANVTVLRDGEVLVTVREATDHVSVDGRMVMFRSQDNGRSWGLKELMYDLGRSDHRSAPIFELPDGEWVTTDYRVGGEYTEEGVWSLPWSGRPTLWGAWSSDRGRSWQFSKEPLAVPGTYPYAEAERHMIRLPSGRLLVAANYLEGPLGNDSAAYDKYRIALFASDDRGRSWQVLAKLPRVPVTFHGECSMLRTASGKVLIVGRTPIGWGQDWMQMGMLYQSASFDDGVTWQQWQPTGMSSMGSPGHLLQLQDGRVLCTHASRAYPGSVYVTVSRDEGETWDTAGTRIVTNVLHNVDSCYPNSGQMADGTIITVWYDNHFGKFYVGALLWRPEQI